MLNIISILYILLLSSSFLMILSNSPAYSIIFFISIFINTYMIFIYFNIDFIGTLLLLVYVGAIAILFLFIIMMLNIKRIEYENNTYFLVCLLIFCMFFLYFIYFFFDFFITYTPTYLSFSFEEDLTEDPTILIIIGQLLFLEYYIILFFSGILLLISLIGSIFLTNFKKGYSSKTQHNQCFRTNNLINSHLQ